MPDTSSSDGTRTNVFQFSLLQSFRLWHHQCTQCTLQSTATVGWPRQHIICPILSTALKAKTRPQMFSTQSTHKRGRAHPQSHDSASAHTSLSKSSCCQNDLNLCLLSHSAQPTHRVFSFAWGVLLPSSVRAEFVRWQLVAVGPSLRTMVLLNTELHAPE